MLVYLLAQEAYDETRRVLKSYNRGIYSTKDGAVEVLEDYIAEPGIPYTSTPGWSWSYRNDGAEYYYHIIEMKVDEELDMLRERASQKQVYIIEKTTYSLDHGHILSTLNVGVYDTHEAAVLEVQTIIDMYRTTNFSEVYPDIWQSDGRELSFRITKHRLMEKK